MVPVDGEPFVVWSVNGMTYPGVDDLLSADYSAAPTEVPSRRGDDSATGRLSARGDR